MAGENRVLPPWGQTAGGVGYVLEHIKEHLVVQHPNLEHLPRGQVVPGDGANWDAGLPRDHPPFSVGFTLQRVVRK